MWEKEPEGVSRITRPYPLWGSRMFSLGNAVVPQQAYPILKCIADIAMGKLQAENSTFLMRFQHLLKCNPRVVLRERFMAVCAPER